MRQEVERLQRENSKLKEDWLELSNQMVSFTGCPDICIGLMRRLSNSKPCWSAPSRRSYCSGTT